MTAFDKGYIHRNHTPDEYELKRMLQRKTDFINSLSDKLYDISAERYPQIEEMSNLRKSELGCWADRASNELLEFMYQRIYEGVDDHQQNPAKFKVAPREEQELNYRDKNALDFIYSIPESERDLYMNAYLKNQEIKKQRRAFLYDCFDLTKKELWEFFPEISELSGTSILHMNFTAYWQMKDFSDHVFTFVE